MSLKPEDCILVIFGASGDLTKRKLIPGLYTLCKRNLLPDHFAVLGIGRTPMLDEDFQLKMRQALDDFGNHAEGDPTATDRFIHQLHYQQLDTKNREDYSRVEKRLDEIGKKMDKRGNVLFYLSTPPSLFEPIVEGISCQGLNRSKNGSEWRRLLVEKPFGYDIGTAVELNANLHKSFSEDQIYRIDHYLGKETVQNLLVLRFGNHIYEPLWNRNYIDRVEVTAAESIGVEDRGGYYEGAGALRDMFQNHLLQVVGMIAMEPPAVFGARSVRNETIKVFESFRPIEIDDVPQQVIRGQYTESTIHGKHAAGYRDAQGVSENSRTETYVAVKFFIDNWRWAGVPFYVRTGKRLPTRVTEAVIHFKQTPHTLFGYRENRGAQRGGQRGAQRGGQRGGFAGHDATTGPGQDSNQLIMRIQPDEGILMKFNLKLPGEGFSMKTVNMDFHYSELSNVYTPEAYERLLLDSMSGDATLYARSDAVEACWRFIDPILRSWERDPDIALHGYPAGTWGPEIAGALFADPHLDWRYPCRNLSNDGEFCEL